MQFGAFNREVSLDHRQLGRRIAYGVFCNAVLLNCASKLFVRVVQALEQTGEGRLFGAEFRFDFGDLLLGQPKCFNQSRAKSGAALGE